MLVGIDLGTTNSAVAYVDGDKIKLFRIPQLNAHGVIEALETLPSFHYLATPEELPDQAYAVGAWARDHGAKVPTRLIHSAKSWLSNAAASRKEKILPFDVADEGRKLTPVEATASYLRHIKEAWNAHFKEEPLEDQEIVLTVPASFDEVARSLTVEAAHLAGLPKLTLLEEPQAAFYNWLGEGQTLEPGETVLVVDVGGGTTDFSLIVVTEDGGYQRMAVGKHLLLGGDNMDAAICHFLDIDAPHQARSAKEALLSGEEKVSLFVAGSGSQLIGGGKSVELTREELDTILLDGFFGLYDLQEARKLAQGSGLRRMGLPYEREPSITKHLAHFLKDAKKPTYILFNGGSMKPRPFQERIIQSIDRWFSEGAPVQELKSKSLDLAVARGAAYYAKAKAGDGIRIRGGLPRAYYLDVGERQVVTLIPRGTDEGTELTSQHTFTLLPNTPVTFQLYHSHTRLNDELGSVHPFEEESMTSLPPIQTVLRFGAHHKERIPVAVSVKITEIGTIELWLSATHTQHTWKLEFNLHGYVKEERLEDETFDISFLEPAKTHLIDAFAVGGQPKLKVLMPTLEHLIARPRTAWSPSVLRGLFEPLMAQAEKRTLAPTYESRFWNLAGFLLRPGCGYPLDDHRVKQLWRCILADASKKSAEEVQIQKWICYRRISAGLSKGQQQQIYSELFPLVYDKKKRRLIVKRKGGYAYAEQIRALAALELIDTPHKIKLGESLVDRITKGHGDPCDFWALGRLGARELIYGSIANVISPDVIEQWLQRLFKLTDSRLFFPFMHLARPTDDKTLNLSTAFIDQVRAVLDEEHRTALLRPLTAEQHELRFGDALPIGLSLQ